MSDFIQDYTKTLKADGSYEQIGLGAYTYLFVQRAAGPFQFSLDGVTFVSGLAGQRIGPFEKATTLTMRTALGVVNTVQVYVSSFPVAYFPTSRSEQTYMVVNSQACSTSVGSPTIISNLDNGKQRKLIVISTDLTSAQTLFVGSLANKQGFRCNSTTPLALESDAIFYCYATAACTINTLELYYSN